MQIANCWLRQNKFGSNIPLRGVTPAEVAILRKGFEGVANGEPISDVVVYGTVNRPNDLELQRLQRKYKNLRVGEDEYVVKTLFSGLGVSLPQTFKEIGVPFVLGKNEQPKNSPDVVLREDEAARLEETVEEVEEAV